MRQWVSEQASHNSVVSLMKKSWELLQKEQFPNPVSWKYEEFKSQTWQFSRSEQFRHPSMEQASQVKVVWLMNSLSELLQKEH